MESVDSHGDIKEFIEDNNNRKKKQDKFEFIPYIPDEIGSAPEEQSKKCYFTLKRECYLMLKASFPFQVCLVLATSQPT